MASPHAQDTQRRNRELSILNAIAEALNRQVDLSQALTTTLAQLVDLFDLKTGWVWLLDEAGESYLAAAQNLPPVLADNPHKMEGPCHCLDTFRAGDMDGAANVNVITCSRLWGLVDGTAGLRYHASIPLYAHGKQLGVLNVASRDWRQLSQEDLRLLYTVGDLLGIAIERARLFARSAEFGAAEERNRLAREIHDTLAQGLAAITLQLETTEALLESHGSGADAAQAVHRALKLARNTLEEARRSVLNLRAAPLEGRTLAQALAALVESHAGHAPPHLTFDATGGGHPLRHRVEVGLYRLAQEALNNALQHAQAGHVEIKLLVTPQQAALTITDDGRGFDPQDIPKGRYGLIGVNERVKLLDGHLDLQTTPGAGTRLHVAIPLEQMS